MEVDYDIAKRNGVKIKNKNKPIIVGKTTTGKYVYGNLFFMIESLGVPIEDTINKIYGNNGLIDWYDFYLKAEKNGWLHKTIFDKISYGFEESEYSEYKNDIIKRLKEILIKRMC